MKCPERFNVVQTNFRKPIIDNELIVRGEMTLFIENQDFKECYKEECAAWDVKENRCRKVGS